MLGCLGARVVQAGDRGRGERRDQRDPRERDGDQGEHPLVVLLAPVLVPLGGAHQQRHDHRGQDPADGEVVDGVRQRVGVVVRVPEFLYAERVDQHDAADQPANPGGQRAERHDAAGADEARGGRVAWLGRSARRRHVTRRRRPLGAAGLGRHASLRCRRLPVPGPLEFGFGQFAFRADAVPFGGEPCLARRRHVGRPRAFQARLWHRPLLARLWLRPCGPARVRAQRAGLAPRAVRAGLWLRPLRRPRASGRAGRPLGSGQAGRLAGPWPRACRDRAGRPRLTWPWTGRNRGSVRRPCSRGARQALARRPGDAVSRHRRYLRRGSHRLSRGRRCLPDDPHPSQGIRWWPGSRYLRRGGHRPLRRAGGADWCPVPGRDRQLPRGNRAPAGGRCCLAARGRTDGTRLPGRSRRPGSEGSPGGSRRSGSEGLAGR